MKATIDKTREDNTLTYAIIGAAMEVHRALGPGFPESVYEQALCVEMRLRNISFIRQAEVRAIYKGEVVGSGRSDVLVDGAIVLELKAVDAISPVHIAQALSYLRMTGYQLALIFNFNVRTLRDGGIERITLAPL
jgi:GxxExxY protein